MICMTFYSSGLKPCQQRPEIDTEQFLVKRKNGNPAKSPHPYPHPPPNSRRSKVTYIVIFKGRESPVPKSTDRKKKIVEPLCPSTESKAVRTRGVGGGRGVQFSPAGCTVRVVGISPQVIIGCLSSVCRLV